MGFLPLGNSESPLSLQARKGVTISGEALEEAYLSVVVDVKLLDLVAALEPRTRLAMLLQEVSGLDLIQRLGGGVRVVACDVCEGPVAVSHSKKQGRVRLKGPHRASVSRHLKSVRA